MAPRYRSIALLCPRHGDACRTRTEPVEYALPVAEHDVVPDRAHPTRAESGLSAAEVSERVARGEVNNVPDAPSRTVAEIIRANLFTRFNALIGALFAIVIAIIFAVR